MNLITLDYGIINGTKIRAQNSKHNYMTNSGLDPCVRDYES